MHIHVHMHRAFGTFDQEPQVTEAHLCHQSQTSLFIEMRPEAVRKD